MGDTNFVPPTSQTEGSGQFENPSMFEGTTVTVSSLVTHNIMNYNFSSNTSVITEARVTDMKDFFGNTSDVSGNITEPLANMTMGTTNIISFSSSVILIVLYTLTTLAALLGNSLAIIVFARGKRSNTDLRPFLINLAVADLIMAIFCIPFTFAYQITDNWIFSDFMCPVVQGCQVVSVIASVSTNTAIGIDRLMAVKFPLRKRVTDSKSKLFILCIWIFAISLGVIPFIMCRTIPRDNGKVSCEEAFMDEDGRVVYGFFITIVTYFLPVTILSVTYTMIGRLLWRHKVPGNADDNRDAAQFKSKRKVVKMLATIVLLFGLCWLPLHLFITITTTFKHNIFGALAYDIYFGVHWLSMANSFVNPVVYGFMNESFRADLKSLAESYICCFWGHRRLRYRPAAVRWRLGDSNVHDTSQSSIHTYISKTMSRGEAETESMKSSQKRPCRNGQKNNAPGFNVKTRCSCHIRPNNVSSPAGTHRRSSGNGTGRNIFIAGKRRHYDLRQADDKTTRSLGENNVLLLKNKYGLMNENVRGSQRCDLHPVVRFDGSDVMVFNDHYKQDQG